MGMTVYVQRTHGKNSGCAGDQLKGQCMCRGPMATTVYVQGTHDNNSVCAGDCTLCTV